MKRVLIVNCYFDDSHQPLHRSRKIPHAMAPVFLAGALNRDESEVRLFDEVTGGPLAADAVAGLDMLVLTGLTNAFDRMLHLTAYARTKNPNVVVVAGGPAVRALPLLARRFFDYVCQGDVEELRDVVTDAFGQQFAAEVMTPRYDLAHWTGRFGYIETSRYCNFRCSFCALTAEGRRYRTYALDDIHRQLAAMGRKRLLMLLDNNFYGNDRRDFLARVELLRSMRDAGHFELWAALVTNDFFLDDDNLRHVRDAGCRCLFSGVESFDTRWLQSRNKTQNIVVPQVDLIRRCLEAGIVFSYGWIADVSSRSLVDLRRELEFITDTPDITLPAFATLAIPLLGTPFFRDCVARKLFLPKTKLRDVDGTTLVLKPLDPLEDAVGFVRDLQSLRGYRWRMLRHSAGFLRRYARHLSPLQMQVALANAALLATPALATASLGGRRLAARRPPRTHVTTTEPLDDVYVPACRVDFRYRLYFQPTMITDAAGELTPAVVDSGALDSTGRDRRSPRPLAATPRSAVYQEPVAVAVTAL
jgi:hypothetical protein